LAVVLQQCSRQPNTRWHQLRLQSSSGMGADCRLQTPTPHSCCQMPACIYARMLGHLQTSTTTASQTCTTSGSAALLPLLLPAWSGSSAAQATTRILKKPPSMSSREGPWTVSRRTEEHVSDRHKWHSFCSCMLQQLQSNADLPCDGSRALQSSLHPDSRPLTCPCLGSSRFNSGRSQVRRRAPLMALVAACSWAWQAEAGEGQWACRCGIGCRCLERPSHQCTWQPSHSC